MSHLILLVEDSQSDEKLTLQAFKRCGVATEIVVARDGADALDYLFGGRKYPDAPPRPTLVLLDLKLPRVDGLEVLRRIRADSRHALLPVVVLTASGEDEDVLQSYAAGANAYVRKPVDFNDFAEAARVLALFWLVRNEAPTGRGAVR